MTEQTNQTEISEDRWTRHRDIIPPERLATINATVIGVGAIGRQVALQLAAVGVPRMTLIDDDIVEPVNLPVQGYWEQDLGVLKVEATSRACMLLNSNLRINLENCRYRRSIDIGNVVFVCIDNIEGRKFIWEALYDLDTEESADTKDIDLFIDGRMAAETFRVISVANEDDIDYYGSTLFNEEDSYQARCTAKGTIYCSNVCAGFMLSRFTQWLRNMPLERDIQMNLLANEINIYGEETVTSNDVS